MTETRQYHLPLPFQESMGAEDFLLSPANEEAALWLLAREASSWPSHALVLLGPEGAGKTHLLSIWVEKNRAMKLAPLDPALAAIAAGAPPAQAFALDDADQVAGDAAREEWLQHLFNATKAAGCNLLLTARAAPALWGLKLRDIETRLKSALTVSLKEPDDELRRGLLLKLFADRQLLVEAGVVDYLAARLERTGTAIRKAVETLDEAALETKRKISVPFAQKILMQDQPKAEDDESQNA